MMYRGEMRMESGCQGSLAGGSVVSVGSGRWWGSYGGDGVYGVACTAMESFAVPRG